MVKKSTNFTMKGSKSKKARKTDKKSSSGGFYDSTLFSHDNDQDIVRSFLRETRMSSRGDDFEGNWW